MSGNTPAERLDTKTILDFTYLLNRLKTNIITQKSLLLNIQPTIGSLLTTRQHALLLVNACQTRVFEWPYHAQTLRAAWELVSRSETPSIPLSPSSPSSPYSPASSPYSYTSSPEFADPSPPTIVPSIAIPTPMTSYPPQAFTVHPLSPSLTATCTSQLSAPPLLSLSQSFMSSLNYGVH